VVPRGDEWGQVLVLLERRGDALVERRSLACRFVPLVGHG
jgi:protein-L-isoaspartate O-methyltransferase